jgi:osmotically-inducible protein OsmY
MIKKVLILISLSLTLQGCIFVAGAAAGAAAIAVVYDHRKLESVVQDQRIATQVDDKIRANSVLHNENAHVNVTCFNQVVLLTGETTTPEMRQEAENIAHNVPDVTRVYNEINVKGPTSTLTRTSDSWITAKIKSQMLATEDLKSGTIKVVTENGSVYLMGIVKHEQADMAVDIARQISGVQKVVKIFKYTD